MHILFSGVIPTNLKVAHEATEIWKMATAFGASCHRDLTSGITHVVTSKVRRMSFSRRVELTESALLERDTKSREGTRSWWHFRCMAAVVHGFRREMAAPRRKQIRSWR